MNRRVREMGERLGVMDEVKHCRRLRECWLETK